MLRSDCLLDLLAHLLSRTRRTFPGVFPKAAHAFAKLFSGADRSAARHIFAKAFATAARALAGTFIRVADAPMPAMPAPGNIAASATPPPRNI